MVEVSRPRNALVDADRRRTVIFRGVSKQYG